MQSASDTQQSSVQSASGASGTLLPSVQFDKNVELIMNERTYIKLEITTENLEEQINSLLRTNFSPDTSFN